MSFNLQSVNQRRSFFLIPHESSDLKQQAVRGGAFTVGAHLAKFALRTACVIVLARLLTPADFGLVAMVLAVTNIATTFQDVGLAEVTLQRESITHEQVSTLFWANVAFGITIALLVVAVGPGLAWFYDQPELAMITAAVASQFLFAGVTSQHRALLRRQMRFGVLGVLEIGAAMVASVCAIVAALAGANHWALVIMYIASAPCMAIGCWIAFPWVPGPPRRGEGVRSMLGFGANVTGFNVATYFARNVDKVLIGRTFSSAALGFYSKAYSLLMLPIAHIGTPLIAVALSAMSRLQTQPDRYRSYYRKLLQSLVFVTAPTVVFLAVFSYEVVLIVLGAQWLPVAGLFRYLAVAALLQSIIGTVGMVMLSSGDSQRYFRLGLMMSVIAVGSFAAGLPWGINGVAAGYSIANLVMLIPMAMYAFKRTPVDVRMLLKAVALPVTASVVSAAVGRGLFLLVRSFSGASGACIIGFAVSCALYIGLHLLLPAGRLMLKDLWANLRSLRGAPAEA